MKTIQSQVNPRLLKKADRLFTGTLSGRVAELVQNARRAGATRVEIANTNSEVIVRDNGRGIEDFASLLDLGGSGWNDDELESSEDPAGVGVFCLAPRQLTIRSRGQVATIDGNGWYGSPVPIECDPKGATTGTELRFVDEPWTKELVNRQAVFSGLTVTVDGELCDAQPFLTGASVHLPELGCRVQVTTSTELSDWHRRLCERGYLTSGVLVNFYGQTVELAEHPIGERGYVCLVDLTGESTGLRLMLPARTRLVENEALQQLRDALELETYRSIARQDSHTLPYEKYRRAHELGVELPEAKPVYRVGLLSNDMDPEPCEVRPPEDWPLERCYRLPSRVSEQDDSIEGNAHLLAALGTPDEPFVPVDIAYGYLGYSWADLPCIERVGCEVGQTLHEDFVWYSVLCCVESITLTAHTSDGKVFRSNVLMAVGDDVVFVTPAARDRLRDSHIWFQLGGFNEEGDTYDTQEYQVREQLTAFWRNLLGPDESLRSAIIEAMRTAGSQWQRATVEHDGTVTITLADGNVKTLSPPKEVAS